MILISKISNSAVVETWPFWVYRDGNSITMIERDIGLSELNEDLIPVDIQDKDLNPVSWAEWLQAYTDMYTAIDGEVEISSTAFTNPIPFDTFDEWADDYRARKGLN